MTGHPFEAPAIIPLISTQQSLPPIRPAERRARQRCAEERGPCRVQCLNLLPHQPSVSECHLIAIGSDGLCACLMYNDPAGAPVCHSLSLPPPKKKGWERRNISKGRNRQGPRGLHFLPLSPRTADTPVRLQPHYQNYVAHLPDPSLRCSWSEMYFLEGWSVTWVKSISLHEALCANCIINGGR